MPQTPLPPPTLIVVSDEEMDAIEKTLSNPPTEIPAMVDAFRSLRLSQDAATIQTHLKRLAASPPAGGTVDVAELVLDVIADARLIGVDPDRVKGAIHRVAHLSTMFEPTVVNNVTLPTCTRDPVELMGVLLFYGSRLLRGGAARTKIDADRFEERHAAAMLLTLGAMHMLAQGVAEPTHADVVAHLAAVITEIRP